MKFFYLSIFLLAWPVFTAATAHKFYVSTTKIEYVEEKQSLQVISKIFIDDMEDILQKRYDPKLSLDTQKERPLDEEYLKKYVLQKLKIKVDGKEIPLHYLGREYENDVVKIFMEASSIQPFKTMEVGNSLLFDLTTQQQNIVHAKYGDERQSLVLDADNPNGLLNFNETSK